MNQIGRENTLMLRNPISLTVKRGPLTELEKAREEASRARADVAAAQQRAEQAKARLLKSTRDAKLRLRMTAVFMITAALVRLAWEGSTQAAVPVANVIPPIGQTAAAAIAVPVPSQATETEVQLDRLRDAFHAFPEEDQPAVVNEVNARYAGTNFACSLAWKEGMPALVVKDQGNAEPLMAGALKQCTAGVEKLRQERDAEAPNLGAHPLPTK